MKSILISIKPKYVAKILNGEKTIEIRKTMPKCGLPIDVYIYCTKEKGNNLHKNRNGWLANEMNVIFVDGKPIYENHNGKVVAKFTLNKVEEIGMWNYSEYGTKTLFEKKLCIKSCLDPFELKNYLNGKNGYAWHISNLEIFDKPKELSEFYKVGYLEENYAIGSHIDDIVGCGGGVNEDYVENLYEELDKEYQLTKAPQSWCYVEVLL